MACRLQWIIDWEVKNGVMRSAVQGESGAWGKGLGPGDWREPGSRTIRLPGTWCELSCYVLYCSWIYCMHASLHVDDVA